MIKNHYEAQLMWHESTDLLVGRTLSAVHKSILNKMILKDRDRLSPSAPFDMVAFYVLAAKSTSQLFGHTATEPWLTYKPVNGFDYPALNNGVWPESLFGRSGLAVVFCDTVRSESVSTGDPFDVRFACEILLYAIGDSVASNSELNTIDWIKEGKGKVCKSLKAVLEEDEPVW